MRNVHHNIFTRWIKLPNLRTWNHETFHSFAWKWLKRLVDCRKRIIPDRFVSYAYCVVTAFLWSCTFCRASCRSCRLLWLVRCQTSGAESPSSSWRSFSPVPPSPSWGSAPGETVIICLCVGVRSWNTAFTSKEKCWSFEPFLSKASVWIGVRWYSAARRKQ